MEVMNYSITTHIFTIYLFGALILFNLYNLYTQKDFFKLASRYKIMTPFFHFINTCIAYTGIIVSAFTHDISPTVILMIITTIFIMVSEIKRYKKMKVIKPSNIQLQNEFKIYAKKVAFMQLSLLILTFIISKFF